MFCIRWPGRAGGACYARSATFHLTEENRTMTSALRPPIQPGEDAPPFALPAVNRDGMVSLDDFRGKSALFIGLYRGLHLSLIHISEPTRLLSISYAVFCL